MKNTTPAEVDKLFNQLEDSILEYESDTFSASGTALTRDEARKIATALTARAIQSLIDTDTMDGVLLSEELETIRPDQEAE